jgi:hypothetical protein
MPELTNPQLVNWANEEGRTFADKLFQLVHHAERAVGEYNQRDLGTIINDGGASELITDGSQTDGRTRVTGGDVFNEVTLMQDFLAFMTQGRRDVVMKWEVNG